MVFAERSKDWASESLCYAQLGMCDMLMEKYDDARERFNKCLRISKSIKAYRLLIECLVCLAYIN